MLSPTKPRLLPNAAASETERTQIKMLWFAVSFLIVFDAVASAVVIDILGVAFEGNGLLMTVAGSLGFGGAMIVRALWGLGCVTLLAYLCFIFKTPERRQFARRGFWILLFIHFGLMAYHIYIVVLALRA